MLNMSRKNISGMEPRLTAVCSTFFVITFLLTLSSSPLAIGFAEGHQCSKCQRSQCEMPRECPGNVVTDTCDCCYECAKQVGESCGGKFSSEGKCDEGLVCVINPKKGSQVTQDLVGVCSEIPKRKNNNNQLPPSPNNNDDDDQCKDVRCDDLLAVLSASSGDRMQLECPADSRLVPALDQESDGMRLAERCCSLYKIKPPSLQLCQCLPCPGRGSLDQVVCGPKHLPILVSTGSMTPGNCCDVYRCVEKDEFCETIQCNDISEDEGEDYDGDHSNGLVCPSDSIELEPDSKFDVCCPRNRGCTCKSKSSCSNYDMTCPVGTMKRIISHGTVIPGSCCDEYDCVNATTLSSSPCLYAGKPYKNSETWSTDHCISCKCESGLSKCVKTQCPGSLSQCEWIGHASNDSCCPVCKGCVANDKLHPNGASWDKDSCISCSCENGRTYCLAQFCAPKCAKPKIVEGLCCPVCDEDETTVTLASHCKSLEDCDLMCPGGYVRGHDRCPICECDGDFNPPGAPCHLNCGDVGFATDPVGGHKLCQCADDFPDSGAVFTTPSPSRCRPLSGCNKQCLYSYRRDKFGCSKCRCNRCPLFECSKKCSAGYQLNADDCRICKCIDSGIFSPSSPLDNHTKSSPAPKGRPCFSANKKKLLDGQVWWDGCRKCFCYNGYEMCELVTCPPIKCTNPIMRSDSCCLSCPGSDPPDRLEGSGTCLSIDGRYFVEGETWFLDHCTQCICHMGTPLCTIDTCPPVLCHHPIILTNSCCSICPHSLDHLQNSILISQSSSPPRHPGQQKNRSCMSPGGVKSSNGDSWRVSSCQSCVCRDGQINCFSQTCPILGCNLTMLKKGHCCPTCLDNTIHYCVHNSLTYDNGESWLVDDCTTCACMDGNVMCSITHCETLSCPLPILVPGKCCPICPINSSCSSKDQHISKQESSHHPINITLIVVLISIIAILAIAIVVLLGMLVWLRPHLSRRLRRSSSATLPASLPSLNPLSFLSRRDHHQPLNDEKSVSSSLLPLNSVSSMVANQSSAQANQRTVLPNGSPIHLSMMKPACSTQKLCLSAGDPAFDPPLSAAVSSMTTASLTSSSLSSSAAKNRLSSLDGCSSNDDRLTTNEPTKDIPADPKPEEITDGTAFPPLLPRKRPPPNDNPIDTNDFFLDVVVDNDDECASIHTNDIPDDYGFEGERARPVVNHYDELSSDLNHSSDVSFSDELPLETTVPSTGVNLFRKTKNYSGNIDVEQTRHLLSSSPTGITPKSNRKSW